MRMRLAGKGRMVPPPVLDAPFQGLSGTVQSWPGIVAATYWHFSRNRQVDGADVYRGGEELGHIHLDGEVHLATSPAIARADRSGGGRATVGSTPTTRIDRSFGKPLPRGPRSPSAGTAPA